MLTRPRKTSEAEVEVEAGPGQIGQDYRYVICNEADARDVA